MSHEGPDLPPLTPEEQARLHNGEIVELNNKGTIIVNVEQMRKAAKLYETEPPEPTYSKAQLVAAYLLGAVSLLLLVWALFL